MSATDDTVTAKIETAILSSTDINRVMKLTVVTDGDAMLVGARVNLDSGLTMNEVSTILALAQQRIREALPTVETIYLEPDVYVDPNLTAPPTSSIVTLSSN